MNESKRHDAARKRTKHLALALATLLLATVTLTVGTPNAHAQAEATYRVEYKNVAGGQYQTPPNWAAHDRGVHVFQLGRAASPGVEAVAELGGVPVLAAELEAALDAQGLGVSGVGADAPIPPGASVSWEFTTSASRFSLVSMLICTNDGFAGIDSTGLPTADGDSRRLRVRAFDAGAELNTENRADLVPAPFCNGPGGTDQDQPEIEGFGTITRHRTLRGVGDLPLSFDWRGAAGEITITRIAAPTTYGVEVENLTGGQYFTPLNYAAHSRGVDVFTVGKPASPGVEAVAELGGVAVLEAELASAIDAAGLGISGVADGPSGPIGPGESRTFDFTTSESRLSIVSMIICTNDGFAGLDSKKLPPWQGESTTYLLRAYDAGAELNTEQRADLVPAPFCDVDGPGGTNQDQPEIEGFGIINPHPTLKGVGDQPASFDWRGPVLKVTVTNNG